MQPVVDVDGTSSGQRRKRDSQDTSNTLPASLPNPNHFPWLETLGTTQYDSKEQRLHDEIVAFAAYIKATPEEKKVREEVVSRVSKVISGRFRDAIVTVFGSVAHDLALPDGDIDLVVYTKHAKDTEEKRRALYQFKSRLLNAGVARASDINVVARARIPIIKFRVVPDLGAYHVDVNINTEDGAKAIDPVKEYLDQMPALRPLVLVLKELLVQRGFNSPATSGLGSYTLICMVISFLQLNPTNVTSSYITSPFEQESLGHLLISFLDYYAHTFSYTTSVIDCRSSALLTKDELGWFDEKAPARLSVRCLINESNDIGKATTKIDAIRALFGEALDKIRTADLTQNNILGTILHLSQKTLEFRKNIKSIVHNGALYCDLNSTGNIASSRPVRQDPDRRPMGDHWQHVRISLGEPQTSTTQANTYVRNPQIPAHRRAIPVGEDRDQSSAHVLRHDDFSSGSHGSSTDAIHHPARPSDHSFRVSSQYSLERPNHHSDRPERYPGSTHEKRSRPISPPSHAYPPPPNPNVSGLLARISPRNHSLSHLDPPSNEFYSDGRPNKRFRRI